MQLGQHRRIKIAVSTELHLLAAPLWVDILRAVQTGTPEARFFLLPRGTLLLLQYSPSINGQHAEKGPFYLLETLFEADSLDLVGGRELLERIEVKADFDGA